MERTDRIAVYGWDEDAGPHLAALERVAGLRPIAVGDRRPAALVQARSATGLPCYQHVLEMLRSADYDVALLNASDGAPQAAHAAAARGAALIVVGTQADAATLMEAAEAALRHHVPLTVMRPRLQQAGLAFALRLAEADPGWRPRYLDLAVTGWGATGLLRDAVAIAGRLFGESPEQAVGSFVGEAPEEATAFTAELRFGNGRLAALRVREANDERLTMTIEGLAGTLELVQTGGTSTLAMALWSGRLETSTLVDGDILALEADRVRGASNIAAPDALLAPRDGATLQAIETAIASGYVVGVQTRSTRANLRLVRSGTNTPTARSGQMHLIG